MAFDGAPGFMFLADWDGLPIIGYGMGTGPPGVGVLPTSGSRRESEDPCLDVASDMVVEREDNELSVDSVSPLLESFLPEIGRGPLTSSGDRFGAGMVHLPVPPEYSFGLILLPFFIGSV